MFLFHKILYHWNKWRSNNGERQKRFSESNTTQSYFLRLRQHVSKCLKMSKVSEYEAKIYVLTFGY